MQTRQRLLEDRFNEAMRGVHVSALRDCGYRATRLLTMAAQMGALKAAERLLDTEVAISYGLEELWPCSRLDLSMEAVITEGDWGNLFTEAELAVARDRLSRLGYRSPGQHGWGSWRRGLTPGFIRSVGAAGKAVGDTLSCTHGV